MHLTQRYYRPRTIPASQGPSTTHVPLHRWAWLRQTGLAASDTRVSASLLPGRDKPFEEEDECGEHKPGKQGVVGPGHLRQCDVGVRGPSSVKVEMDIPRHEENEGQTSHAKPEYQQERKQEGLEREVPSPLLWTPDARLCENPVFQGVESFDPVAVAPGHCRVEALFGPRMQVEEYALQAERGGQQGPNHDKPDQKNDQGTHRRAEFVSFQCPADVAHVEPQHRPHDVEHVEHVPEGL